MNNKQFFIKQKKQNPSEINEGCHRFTFWYSGRESEAICSSSMDIIFKEKYIPEDIKNAVIREIYKILDNTNNNDKLNNTENITSTYCDESFFM